MDNLVESENQVGDGNSSSTEMVDVLTENLSDQETLHRGYAVSRPNGRCEQSRSSNSDNNNNNNSSNSNNNSGNKDDEDESKSKDSNDDNANNNDNSNGSNKQNNENNGINNDNSNNNNDNDNRNGINNDDDGNKENKNNINDSNNEDNDINDDDNDNNNDDIHDDNNEDNDNNNENTNSNNSNNNMGNNNDNKEDSDNNNDNNDNNNDNNEDNDSNDQIEDNTENNTSNDSNNCDDISSIQNNNNGNNDINSGVNVESEPTLANTTNSYVGVQDSCIDVMSDLCSSFQPPTRTQSDLLPRPLYGIVTTKQRHHTIATSDMRESDVVPRGTSLKRVLSLGVGNRIVVPLGSPIDTYNENDLRWANIEAKPPTRFDANLLDVFPNSSSINDPDNTNDLTGPSTASDYSPITNVQIKGSHSPIGKPDAFSESSSSNIASRNIISTNEFVDEFRDASIVEIPNEPAVRMRDDSAKKDWDDSRDEKQNRPRDLSSSSSYVSSSSSAIDSMECRLLITKDSVTVSCLSHGGRQEGTKVLEGNDMIKIVHRDCEVIIRKTNNSFENQ